MSDKKTPVGKVLGFGCLGLLVLGFVCGAIGIFMMSKLFKNSEPYASALSRAQQNTSVIEALGQPIEPGFLPSGSFSTSGPSGEVSLAIGVSGPKEKGTIYVEGKKAAGNWNYSVLEVEVDGQSTRIPLGQ